MDSMKFKTDECCLHNLAQVIPTNEDGEVPQTPDSAQAKHTLVLYDDGVVSISEEYVACRFRNINIKVKPPPGGLNEQNELDSSHSGSNGKSKALSYVSKQSKEVKIPIKSTLPFCNVEATVPPGNKDWLKNSQVPDQCDVAEINIAAKRRSPSGYNPCTNPVHTSKEQDITKQSTNIPLPTACAPAINDNKNMLKLRGIAEPSKALVDVSNEYGPKLKLKPWAVMTADSNGHEEHSPSPPNPTQGPSPEYPSQYGHCEQDLSSPIPQSQPNYLNGLEKAFPLNGLCSPEAFCEGSNKPKFYSEDNIGPQGWCCSHATADSRNCCNPTSAVQQNPKVDSAHQIQIAPRRHNVRHTGSGMIGIRYVPPDKRRHRFERSCRLTNTIHCNESLVTGACSTTGVVKNVRSNQPAPALIPDESHLKLEDISKHHNDSNLVDQNIQVRVWGNGDLWGQSRDPGRSSEYLCSEEPNCNAEPTSTPDQPDYTSPKKFGTADRDDSHQRSNAESIIPINESLHPLHKPAAPVILRFGAWVQDVILPDFSQTDTCPVSNYQSNRK